LVELLTQPLVVDPKMFNGIDPREVAAGESLRMHGDRLPEHGGRNRIPEPALTPDHRFWQRKEPLEGAF